MLQDLGLLSLISVSHTTDTDPAISSSSTAACVTQTPKRLTRCWRTAHVRKYGNIELTMLTEAFLSGTWLLALPVACTASLRAFFFYRHTAKPPSILRPTEGSLRRIPTWTRSTSSALPFTMASRARLDWCSPRPRPYASQSTSMRRLQFVLYPIAGIHTPLP